MKKKSPRKSNIALDGNTDDLHGLRSIVSAIKQDHDDLRELIETLTSENANLSKKKKAYKDFSALLKSHAKCEEKAVYSIAAKVKDLKVATFEAYEEHAVAESLMTKIAKTTNSDQWEGRVKVLAEAVEHHIIEEESEYLGKVQKKLKGDDETAVLSKFLSLRVAFKPQPNQGANGVLNPA